MLPIEIIELIFSKVNDKKTILSIRLTNKYFYVKHKEVIDYDKKLKYIFNKNSYQTYNIEHNYLENEIIFKLPCYYIYKEYNIAKIVTKQIKSSLFELEKTDYILYSGFKKINYNIYKNTNTESTVTYPPLNCSIM